jgi:SAM-dependent methyltransferase
MIYQEDVAYIHHVGYGDFASKAAPEWLSILKREGIRKGTIVDLGCGSGIWARAAEQAGFHVTGLDSSPAMIRLARTVAPCSEFRCVSLDEASLPQCDVITANGEVFKKEIKQALERAGFAVKVVSTYGKTRLAPRRRGFIGRKER